MSLVVLFFFSLLLVPLSVNADSIYSDEDELALAFGDQEMVSIATGRAQPISKAPAVASVITSKEINQIGARTLEEILETVPGIHVSVNAGGYNPIITMRGVFSSFNPQILILVNGAPTTNLLFGNRGEVWGGMPVENISRIEVIRGPGSAIYGADAFAGTINIVTKKAQEIDGWRLGMSYGSFEEKRFWGQFGGNIAGWDLATSIELLRADGHDEKIDTDFQAQLDFIAGTSASLAPGSVNLGKENLDFSIELSKGNWIFNLGYRDRNDLETGAGSAQSLDPNGSGDGKRINVEGVYSNKDFANNWELETRLSYFEAVNKTLLTLQPAGSDFNPAPGIDFPEGIIGHPEVYERHYRFDTSLYYVGFEDHDIRIGLGYHYLDQYKVQEEKNFVFNFMFGIPVPLGSNINVTGSDIFNREEVREVSYLFVQDEWRFSRDWSLTAGVRYDHYSDFGDTFNPRVALVWDTTYQLTSKLLYGRAFRAPSFAEQFNQANPVALGNDSLDPETIDTYELAFDYVHSGNLKVGLNLFYYEMQDIIRFTPVAQNTGDQIGHGLELEFDWDITRDLSLKGNYAYQDSEDDETSSDAANAPQHQLYVRADYQVDEHWSANLQANHVMDRQRADGDTRSDIDDFTTLDFTVRGVNLLPGLDIALSVRNLTDEEVLEPSLYDPLTGTVSIPNDLPQAGRAIFAEIRKTWR